MHLSNDVRAQIKTTPILSYNFYLYLANMKLAQYVFSVIVYLLCFLKSYTKLIIYVINYC